MRKLLFLLSILSLLSILGYSQQREFNMDMKVIKTKHEFYGGKDYENGKLNKMPEFKESEIDVKIEKIKEKTEDYYRSANEILKKSIKIEPNNHQVIENNISETNDYFYTNSIVCRYNGNIIGIDNSSPYDIPVGIFYLDVDFLNKDDLKILIKSNGWELRRIYKEKISFNYNGTLNSYVDYHYVYYIVKVISLEDDNNYILTKNNKITFTLETIKVSSNE
jgi:hypothetical protein